MDRIHDSYVTIETTLRLLKNTTQYKQIHKEDSSMILNSEAGKSFAECLTKLKEAMWRWYEALTIQSARLKADMMKMEDELDSIINKMFEKQSNNS